MENHNLLKLWNGTPGILQHEIDHLRGTLYIDRMETRTFTSLDNWSRFWKASRSGTVVESLSNPYRTYSVNLAVPHSSPEVWAVRV